MTIDAQQTLQDYRLAYRSRQASYIGRREVMSGKAKFGIFGDGKELPQLAMARFFEPGDWRSGYYRDQTFMFATGHVHHPGIFRPALRPRRRAGRAGHRRARHERPLSPRAASTRMAAGKTRPPRATRPPIVSPTGSQMPRAVGLAYASKLYRQLDELKAIHPVFQRRE